MYKYEVIVHWGEEDDLYPAVNHGMAKQQSECWRY
jgi:hypothetical protein